MKTIEDARRLAETMVRIGTDAGRKTVALLSDMNQPLGQTIGNALEVKEAIHILHDHDSGPEDVWLHCRTVAAHMLRLADAADTFEEAEKKVTHARTSGDAWQKFRQMVIAQGGDANQIDRPDNLPQAPYQHTVAARRGGYIRAIDTAAVGWATVTLGGGRAKKGDAIDPAVGLMMPVKIGQRLNVGDPLATIHAADEAAADEAAATLQNAIHWSDAPVPKKEHILGTVTAADLPSSTNQTKDNTP